MRKRKTVLAISILAGVLLMALCCCGFTWNRASISEFEGVYLCDVSEEQEYENQELILSFNDDGNLMRTDSLYYGTIDESTPHTDTCRDYTEYKIEGNTLTGKYDGLYDYYYGPTEDSTGGTDEYVLTEEGNLESDGHIWYRYTGKTSYLTTESGTLMEVTETDFPDGNFSKNAPFLGNTRLQRQDVEQITFLSSLYEKPDDAWDVSANQDGSVYAWVDQSNGVFCVYIAAEDGVTANRMSNNLFRCCVNLQSIDFNDSFQVTDISTMAYMFAECSSLTKLDMTDFMEAAAQDMKKMFYNCSSLTELNMTESMFAGEEALFNYTDMFTGTKWEGTSPLLDGDSETLTVSYLLDAGSLINNDTALTIHIYQGYDDKIGELIDDYGSDDGMMRAVSDLDADSVPELVIRTEYEDDQYFYSVYAFCVESCRIYSTYEISSDEIAEMDLDYRYVMPEYVDSLKIDIDGDGEKEQIDVAVLRDYKDIDFLKIYVDSKGAYSMDVESPGWNNTEVDVDAYSLENENGFLYLRVYCDNRGEYCGLLNYDSGKFSEMLEYTDLIDSSQWEDDYQSGYFEVETEYTENSNVQLNFVFDSLTLGEKFSFTAEYNYIDGECEQNGYLSEINALQYSFYTLADDCELYQYPGSTETAFSGERGQIVYPEKVWISNGYLWIYVIDREGQGGWLPMCGTPFVEISWSPESNAGKKVEQNAENPDTYGNLEEYTAEELSFFGDCKFDAGDYESALLYYQYAKELDEDAAGVDEGIEKTMAAIRGETEEEGDAGNGEAQEALTDSGKTEEEENAENNEDGAGFGESADESADTAWNAEIQERIQAFETRMTEGFIEEYSELKKPLSYYVFDWDGDGCEEYILRRVLPDDSALQQWLVDYDPLSDTYETEELTLSETPDNETLYFWEERAAIVCEDAEGKDVFFAYSLDENAFLLNTYSDMTYLPQLEFQVIEEGNGVSISDVAVIWKNEVNLEEYQDIYIHAIRDGEENIWTDYEELEAAFYDVNGDGKQEMIMRGEQYELLCAVYCYDESTKEVVRAGTTKAFYDTLVYYSPGHNAMVIAGHSSGASYSYDWYTFYSLTKSGFEEEFQISVNRDYIEEILDLYFTENGEQTLLSEVNYENEDMTDFDSLWDSYIGDLVDLEFEALENIPYVDPDASAVSVQCGELYGEDDYAYLLITGINEAGEVCWSMQTDAYDEIGFAPVHGIEQYGDRYYYYEDGSIVALNVSDGSRLWKTDVEAYGLSVFTADENNCVYTSGFYGPNLLVLDQNGNITLRIDSFEPSYYWPTRIESGDGKVRVTFCAGGETDNYSATSTAEHNNKVTFVVNQEDGSYTAVYFPDLGETAEGEAYRQFMQNAYYSEEILLWDNTWYAVDDVNEDGVLELILSGEKDGIRDYLVYCYDGTEVQQFEDETVEYDLSVMDYTYFEPTDRITHESDVSAVTASLEIFYEKKDEVTYEYGIVTGWDAEGKEVWEYQTTHSEAAQITSVQEIGISLDRYYFTESGTLVALSLSDGEMLWSCSGCAGEGTVAEDGTVYLCSYLGSVDFQEVSPDGEIVYQIEEMAEGYYWPYSVTWLGDKVSVTFEGYPEGGEPETTFYVYLSDYHVEKADADATAEDQTENQSDNSDGKLSMFEQYRNIVAQKEAEYGTVEILADDYSYRYLAGVCFIKLLDFDDDDVKELLLYYKDKQSENNDRYLFDIYQYDADTGTANLAISAEGTSETNGGWRAVSIFEIDGKPYILADIWETDVMRRVLYGAADGEFGIVEELRAVMEWDDQNVLHSTYYIDGLEVTQDDYSAEQSNWFSYPEEQYYLRPVDAQTEDGASITDTTIAKVKEIRQELGLEEIL